MNIAENKAIAVAFIERFSTGNIDHAHELLADDLEWVVTGDFPPLCGSHDKRSFRATNDIMVNACITPPQWIVDGTIAEGNKVAVEAHSIGDMKNGFAYRNKYHLLLTLRDGKIVKVIEYMDTKHVWDCINAMNKSN